MSKKSFLDKDEKLWFVTNALCWPLIILGLGLALNCSPLIGVPMVVVPFITIVWVMWKLMLGDSNE